MANWLKRLKAWFRPQNTDWEFVEFYRCRRYVNGVVEYRDMTEAECEQDNSERAW